MREFAFVTERAHVEQLRGHCRVEDKVAVEQSFFLVRVSNMI